MVDETGGKAYFPLKLDDLAVDFQKIGDELRSQYVIAYTPTNQNLDGTLSRGSRRDGGQEVQGAYTAWLLRFEGKLTAMKLGVLLVLCRQQDFRVPAGPLPQARLEINVVQVPLLVTVTDSAGSSSQPQQRKLQDLRRESPSEDSIRSLATRISRSASRCLSTRVPARSTIWSSNAPPQWISLPTL